jgi:CO/xanthine dehydrogenase Mo-binding subunit
MLVDGQIHGGFAQGLGGALLEEFNYDSEGQLLVGSFMDYLCPGASDVPHLDLIHMHFPSPLNPLGVKGVGEGSAIAPPVVIAKALADLKAKKLRRIRLGLPASRSVILLKGRENEDRVNRSSALI